MKHPAKIISLIVALAPTAAMLLPVSAQTPPSAQTQQQQQGQQQTQTQQQAQQQAQTKYTISEFRQLIPADRSRPRGYPGRGSENAGVSVRLSGVSPSGLQSGFCPASSITQTSEKRGGGAEAPTPLSRSQLVQSGKCRRLAEPRPPGSGLWLAHLYASVIANPYTKQQQNSQGSANRARGAVG
jgi:hypothetical protein